MSEASGKRCSVTAAAEGVLLVANTNMERALRHISVERGHDPRRFALLPFGGAGGLHAVELARALRIPYIIAPPSGGTLSAVGVLVADVIKDQSRTVMLACERHASGKLERVFKELEREARVALDREGFARSRQRHERSLGMRYRGQSFELEIKGTRGDFAGSFHRAHLQRYGYAQEGSEIEIVSARLRSLGLVETLPETRIKQARQKGLARPHDLAEIYLDGKRVRAAVYRRDELLGGVKLRTPCVVTEYSATTLIPAAAMARVDHQGNLIIQV
jgi:N-methylhydantoinase A